MAQNQPSKIQYLYAAISVVIGSAVMWTIANGIITWKDISVAFLTLLSTFLGALFAFRLNESKENRKTLSEQRAALNRGLFVLARQLNAVKSFAKHLEPFNTEIKRALMLPACKPPIYESLRQDFEDIEFLLEHGQTGLLMRLAVEDERFHQTFESIRIRNDFYVNEVLPELERHSFQGKDVTDKVLHDALGERIMGSAINHSKSVYLHIGEGMKSIPQVHAELHVAAKVIFPQDKFLNFEAET